MPPKVPKVKLNNGKEIPVLGLGTWKAAPGDVTQAVKDAIDAGYRHIDCAMIYGNEAEVGAALKDKIKAGVKREDLFITSKLWCSFHSKNLVVPTLKKTLKDLGLDYLDLYLIHWPIAFKEGGDMVPFNPDGKTIACIDVDYIKTWEAMEEALKLGLTKSIGISNFNSKQVERLLQNSKVTPAINQIEISPYMTNLKLVKLCQSKKIAVTGYSQFGGNPDRPGAQPDDPKPLQDKLLIEIGKKYKKTSGQVILRWLIQHNIITIPKSVHKNRIEENINVFDFTLASDEMNKIDGLNRNFRTATLEWCAKDKYYPFGIEF